MNTDHFKINAKSYASGAASLLGSVGLTLAEQPITRQGVEYISELGWINIALFVFASFGITWGVSNKTSPVSSDATATQSVVSDPAKRGDHAA